MTPTRKKIPKIKVKKPSSFLEILYIPSPTKVKAKSVGRIKPIYKNSGDLPIIV